MLIKSKRVALHRLKLSAGVKIYVLCARYKQKIRQKQNIKMHTYHNENASKCSTSFPRANCCKICWTFRFIQHTPCPEHKLNMVRVEVKTNILDGCETINLFIKSDICPARTVDWIFGWSTCDELFKCAARATFFLLKYKRIFLLFFFSSIQGFFYCFGFKLVWRWVRVGMVYFS